MERLVHQNLLSLSLSQRGLAQNLLRVEGQAMPTRGRRLVPGDPDLLLVVVVVLAGGTSHLPEVWPAETLATALPARLALNQVTGGPGRLPAERLLMMALQTLRSQRRGAKCATARSKAVLSPLWTNTEGVPGTRLGRFMPKTQRGTGGSARKKVSASRIGSGTKSMAAARAKLTPNTKPVARRKTRRRTKGLCHQSWTERRTLATKSRRLQDRPAVVTQTTKCGSLQRSGRGLCSS